MDVFDPSWRHVQQEDLAVVIGDDAAPDARAVRLPSARAGSDPEQPERGRRVAIAVQVLGVRGRVARLLRVVGDELELFNAGREGPREVAQHFVAALFVEAAAGAGLTGRLGVEILNLPGDPDVR